MNRAALLAVARRWFGRAFGALLCAALLAIPRSAGAAFEFKSQSWEGTSELLAIARERLGKARVRVVANVSWDELQPSDALLILHPERDLDYRDAAAFLAAGGRLGLVDDYGKADALLSRFRIHRVRAPLDPAETLRENPELPIAVPAEATPDAVSHPIVAGVDRVVLNHPTALETDPGLRLTTVLEIRAVSEPAEAFALIGVIGDAKRCGLLGSGIESPLGEGVAATGRCGRLFAMGDPSALMNLMLRYPGNRTLATRLVDYLVSDDTWGKRGGTLYLVANGFSESGSFGGHGGLLGGIDDRLEALARLVAETRREGLPPVLALLLAVLLAAAAGLWAVFASTRRYRRATPRYARRTPAVAQGGLAGRAAVLSAETTHRALAILELKAALEESLRDRLGLPLLAGTRDIAEEINRRGALGRRNSKALSDLFAEMAKAEERVTRTERIRVTAGTVRRMHESMTAVLSELDERLGKRT